ncbi:MAG: pyridoxamine 5'-phosphate oxidase [Actinomycetes bacterium]
MPDLFTERMDYSGAHLREDEVPEDPYALFDHWLVDAFAARDRGELAEPTAMVVATCAEGRPSTRTVLLKELTPTGFVFFTNYASRKATELEANDQVALHFGWYALQRQVRIEGRASRTPRSESEAYFASRPRASQLGAWASPQSSEVESLAALAASYRRMEERFAEGPVPCPDHWGGYRVAPETLEFWQGQPSRMHDRLVYRHGSGGWTVTRLAP